jgi:hypothetical protein
MEKVLPKVSNLDPHWTMELVLVKHHWFQHCGVAELNTKIVLTEQNWQVIKTAPEPGHSREHDARIYL